MTIRDAVAVTGGEYFGAPALLEDKFQGAVKDNRKVYSGCLFFCFPGNKTDGHLFARDSVQRGAICAVAERPVDTPYILVKDTGKALLQIAEEYRKSLSFPIVGVTGSVGKTTTKEMIKLVLQQKFRTASTVGNENNSIGLPLSVLSAKKTDEAAVFELGISDFGEMEPLVNCCEPTIGVITRIGESHLEKLIDRDGVLREKSQIYSRMDETNLAIVNGDDDKLVGLKLQVPTVTFGSGEHNDYRFVLHAGNNESISFSIIYGETHIDATVNAYGNHIACAAAAAAAVGDRLGLTADEIKSGIEAFTPEDGRAKLIKLSRITLIDDCYNANTDSMRNALDSLSAAKTRRVAILGDMKELGSSSKTKHQEIALYAKDRCDILLSCGDMWEGCGGTHFADKSSLIAALENELSDGDTVLVKASHSMGFEEIVSKLKEIYS